MTTDVEKAGILAANTAPYLVVVGDSIKKIAILNDNYSSGFGTGGSNAATAAVAGSFGVLKEWLEFLEGVMSTFGNDSMDPPAPPTGG